MERQTISDQALKRLPLYLSYLRSLPEGQPPHISATTIAQALRLNDGQVRKDLAAVSSGGRPKVGYEAERLAEDLEKFLGCGEARGAVLVGVGNLGRALLCYQGFSSYGLSIVAAFDADTALCGGLIGRKPIYPMDRLEDICLTEGVRIGIVTVPAHAAQAVADQLVRSGIEGIWNFAPLRLRVPSDVLVQNENMVSSLAVLSIRLNESRSTK